MGRFFAKEREFDLVVSRRQDDVFSCLAADDGAGPAEGEGTLGLDCADVLEKKPKMLCCFRVDDSMALPFLAVDGVLAGVCLWGSDLSTIAASATAQLRQIQGQKLQRTTTPNTVYGFEAGGKDRRVVNI